MLDESFLSLSDLHADLERPLPDNLPDRVAALDAVRPAWPTGTLAQAAGRAAVGAERFVAESRERLRDDRRALAEGLRGLGLSPLASAAPYLAVPVGDAPALRRRLLARGILVRDCASFGLDGHLRVAVRPAPERARLLAALAEELR